MVAQTAKQLPEAPASRSTARVQVPVALPPLQLPANTPGKTAEGSQCHPQGRRRWSFMARLLPGQAWLRGHLGSEPMDGRYHTLTLSLPLFLHITFPLT